MQSDDDMLYKYVLNFITLALKHCAQMQEEAFYMVCRYSNVCIFIGTKDNFNPTKIKWH